jgi:FixJ family two-component response regulator
MAEETRGEIFVVDDDAAVRNVLSTIFSQEGYDVATFGDGASFIAAAHKRTPACVILDVNMPGRSGLDVLRELRAESYGAPIFMISGHGDIPMAIEAIKNGALDFIEKPFRADTVLAQVRAAIEAGERRAQAAEHVDIRPLNFSGRDLLTPREFDVLALIAKGASSKEAGRDLGISPRTIEVHRAHIMEKLGAKNTADLVRIVLTEARRE